MNHIDLTLYQNIQMVNCIQEDNGSLTISWDPNDPAESILNTWTEEDFIRTIMEHLEKNNGKL